VSAQGSRWTLVAKAHRFREVTESRAELAEILGLRAEDIAERPLWVNTGREQLIIPLVSDEAVQRARPSADAFTRLKSDDGASMAYVFHDAGERMGTVLSRFFFPSGAAVLEDPATGSACANLGGWFRALHPGAGVERVISQGAAVHRPSTLFLSVPPPSAMGDGGRIFVGGHVIELGRGHVEL
jgi:PhzF family phenazine biosynthesis protein